MEHLPDYRHDPIAYEAEERARPDEMRMLGQLAATTRALIDSMPAARILDACCGTGLSMVGALEHPNAAQVVGLDMEPTYLRYAQRNLHTTTHTPQLVQADAVAPPFRDATFDIIILASAYHHIQNNLKRQFLQLVGQLLTLRGRVVLAENVLPEHVVSDPDAYRAAISAFYAEVILDAQEFGLGLDPWVLGLIRRVVKYGHDGDYEWKTSLDTLLDHIRNSQLQVISSQRVWPSRGPLLNTTGGNYVMVLRATSTLDAG